MPNQFPNPPPTFPDAPPADARERKPAIHTMRSDVTVLLKTTKPSLLQMIERSGGFPATKTGPGRRRYLLYISGGVFLVAAVFFAALLLLPELEETIEPPPKLVPPPPYFATETSRTINVNERDKIQFLSLMQDALAEQEREGTVKRLAVKLQNESGERFAEFSDLVKFYSWAPPTNLLGRLDPPLMIFVYYSREGPRMGLATRSRDPDRTTFDMLSWESTIFNDFRPFLFPEGSVTSVVFEDRTYRNIDWRFFKITGTDSGIGHTIFPARNILVIATGKTMMETVINRLFDAR